MSKLFLTVLLVVGLLAGCTGGSQPIAIILSAISATVKAGGTVQFTATLQHDKNNKGVTWTVTCSVAQCGTVSPTMTTSGLPTTYTAPSAPPASDLTVTITVTSVADSTKKATITVTVPAITISVAPSSATVPSGSTAQFTATVNNDSASTPNVAWTVTCSVAQCGSVAPTTTASGVATTYTAPANPPTNTLTVTITATSATDSSKSNGATITVPAATISVSPTTATVLAGNTKQFTAAVTNTPNTGVTWTVTCSAASCGNVNSSTANPVTYTAPSPPASDLTVTITATSAADSTKKALATITVPAITVSVAPSSANVPVKGTANYTATVGNDAANNGVTWTLTQGGTACSPACGTITASTASGAPATYTAPATVPANATVTITATSVADTTKSAPATATIVGISVSISPTTASVVVSATQNFTATVSNDISGGGVTWTLTQGGAACAPATCGSVSPASGTGNTPSTTYTAPATVPSTATVTITATSAADPTKSAPATITVTVAPPITVTISPTNPTVNVSATQSFTATVTNDPTASGVAWTLTQSGAACSPACGSVSPTSGTGNSPMTTYTAPATVPTPATVTITATSAADNTKSAFTTITVNSGPPPNARLNGPYVFSFQGVFDVPHSAGLLTFDGNGNVTGVVVDANGGSQVSPPGGFVPVSGTYSLGADGRGSLILIVGPAGPSQITVHTRIALESDTVLRIIGFGPPNEGTGYGSAVKQTSTTIASGTTYVFLVRGAQNVVVLGRFTAMAGTITGGMMDISVPSPEMLVSVNFGGSYTCPDPAAPTIAGRCDMTLNIASPPAGVPPTLNFKAYVASPTELRLVNTDTSVSLSGIAEIQSSTTFAAGDYSFYTAGQALDLAGRFHFDGNMTFSDTRVDVNDQSSRGGPSGKGSLLEDQQFNTSNYTANTTTGRVSLDISLPPGTPAAHFVLLTVSSSRAYLMGAPSSDGSAGEVFLQQGAPFTSTNLSGNFTYQMFGEDQISFSGSNDFTRQGVFTTSSLTSSQCAALSLPACGTIAATQDQDDGDILTVNTPLVGTFAAAPAPPSPIVDHGDKWIINLGGDTTLRFYAASPTRLALLSLDPNVNHTGVANGSTNNSAVTNASRFVYFATGSAIDGLAIDDATGNLTPLPGSPFASGAPAGVFSLDRAAPFLYTAPVNLAQITGLQLAPSSGNLTLVPGSPFTGVSGTAGTINNIAVEPTGRYMYMPAGSGGVAGFTIDQTNGALAPISGSPFAGGAFAERVAVHPTGRFVYSHNPASPSPTATVSAFQANFSSGALTQVGSPSATGSAAPDDLTAHPSGKFLYALEDSGQTNPGQIFAFQIDPFLGALTALPAPFATFNSPTAMAIHPNGRFAYVVVPNAVQIFSIDPTGALTLAGSVSSTAASKVRIDSAGKRLFVSSGPSLFGTTLSVFDIDPSTGALTPVSGSPFTIGSTKDFVLVP